MFFAVRSRITTQLSKLDNSDALRLSNVLARNDLTALVANWTAALKQLADDRG